MLPGIAVHPEFVTRIGIERVERDALGRPDARAGIENAVPHDRSSAQGPARHHAIVADNHAIAGGKSLSARQALTGRSREAIQVSVVAPRHMTWFFHMTGAKRTGASVTNDHRLTPRIRVDSVDRAVGRRPEKERAARHNRFICVIESHPRVHAAPGGGGLPPARASSEGRGFPAVPKAYTPYARNPPDTKASRPVRGRAVLRDLRAGKCGKHADENRKDCPSFTVCMIIYLSQLSGRGRKSS